MRVATKNIVLARRYTEGAVPITIGTAPSVGIKPKPIVLRANRIASSIVHQLAASFLAMTIIFISFSEALF